MEKPLNANMVYYNVSSVQGPLHWINDFATTRTILQELEPQQKDLEYDSKCYAKQEELFFYNMMSSFRLCYLDQRNSNCYATHFNIGYSFDVTKCRRAKDYSLLCLKGGELYAHGAIYKRFRNGTDAFIFIWENGECYVTARDKYLALWICGVMNYNLQQMLLEEDLKKLTAAEKSEGKMLLRTREIREKKLDGQLRSNCQAENRVKQATRVQPDRRAKLNNKNGEKADNKQC